MGLGIRRIRGRVVEIAGCAVKDCRISNFITVTPSLGIWGVILKHG